MPRYIALIGLLLISPVQAQTFEDFERRIDAAFADTDAQIEADFLALEEAIDRAFNGLTDRISVNWGDDVQLPSKTTWVTYNDTFNTRISLDYATNMVTVEAITEPDDLAREQAIDDVVAMVALVKTADKSTLDDNDQFMVAVDTALEQGPLATAVSADDVLVEVGNSGPSDASSSASATVDPSNGRSDDAVTIESLLIDVNEAVLRKRVIETFDHAKTESSTMASEDAIAGELQPTETGQVKVKIQFPFSNKFQQAFIERYLEGVRDLSRRYGMDVATLLAIIETESSFNPRAMSPIPAFGLMQIVPTTAGIDAYRYLYGEKRVVTPDYLFDASNNMQMGAAYFHLLSTRYLAGVEDPQNRFLCAVASYNTGIGNLAKTFTRGRASLSDAVAIINTMSPEEVEAYLLEYLPAAETRNYVVKIIKRRQQYRYLNEVAT